MTVMARTAAPHVAAEPITQVPIHVQAPDEISRAGLAAQLRFEHALRLVDENAVDETTIGVVAVDTLDDHALQLLRDLNSRGCRRIVLVITALAETDLVTTIEHGVCAIVHRSNATPARLVDLATKAASGESAMPPDILGRLLKQVSRLQHNVLRPRGLNMTGLSGREVEVLKLVADGYDTQEVARKLCYSERTVKNALHDVTNRFNLRNRTHAVAYALREGLI